MRVRGANTLFVVQQYPDVKCATCRSGKAIHKVQGERHGTDEGYCLLKSFVVMLDTKCAMLSECVLHT